MKFRDPKTLIEQFALIFASFIWTAIIMIALVLFWAYTDVQARWDYVVNAPPEALAQAAPAETATPTVTVWAGPGATLTPTPTLPPTSVPTRVIAQPEMLPETFNPGESPIPVIVHTADEAQEYGVAQSAPVNINIQPTPVPAPAEQVVPPTPAPPQAEVPSGQNVPPILSNPFPDDPSPPAGISGAIPSHLVIDSVGINSEVIPVGWSVIEKDGYEYSIWQVADYAVGWHKTTAALGQPGNTVMAGHHNVNGEIFRDLVNVEVGDKVTIYAGDTKYEYIVDLKTIVKEKGEPVEVRKRNAQWIAPTNDERITFVTCWPYTNNTHRVIVVAKPV